MIFTNADRCPTSGAAAQLMENRLMTSRNGSGLFAYSAPGSRHSSLHRASRLVLTLPLLLAIGGSAPAATKTWDAGVNNTWDTATTANWTSSNWVAGDDAVHHGEGNRYPWAW